MQAARLQPATPVQRLFSFFQAGVRPDCFVYRIYDASSAKETLHRRQDVTFILKGSNKALHFAYQYPPTEK